MSGFNWIGPFVAGHLLTYCVHSTLLIAGVALVSRFLRAPELRVGLWRFALFAPVLTTLLASYVDVAPRFWRLSVAGRSATEELAGAAEDTSDSHTLPQWTGAPPEAASAPSASAGGLSDVALDSPQSRTVGSSPESEKPAWLWLAALSIWLVGAFLLCLNLTRQVVRLNAVRRNASPLENLQASEWVRDYANHLNIQPPELLQSEAVSGPVTLGVARPCILLPPGLLRVLGAEEQQALFAHEMVHVRRRDNLWKLLAHLVSRVFFMQPLNLLVVRQLELDTEFVADTEAARLLHRGRGLAICLSRLAEWLVDRPQPSAPLPTVGMASLRSPLGRRIEVLLGLGDSAPIPTPRPWGVALTAAAVAAALLAAFTAPRAVAESPWQDQNHLPKPEETTMKPVATFALLAGLTANAVAQDTPKESPQRERPAITKTTPDELPDGIARFNGVLVGRVVSKDIEKGTFVLNVDAVPRVWRNSKAKNPKSLVGRNVEVDGVSGKWLDVLLVVKKGETLECEARHDGGSRLTFPGELLRKVAPFEAGDYPELPEGFRGFQGAVAGKIVKKDAELFEMIVHVDKVLDTWKKNDAKQPESIVGKPMMLAGFWRRKEDFHRLKVGDRIEVGLQHISPRSDHLSVAEFIRKASSSPTPSSNSSSLPDGFEGFLGSLVGELVEKDVEKGTLSLKVQAVPRVWRNNKSRRPKSMIGKTVRIEGVSSRLLDVLLTTRKGETLEVAARHEGGDHLSFPGELFRKVAPYKAEDYPVLPDAFRGFEGVLQARIVKKDPGMYGLIIQVDDVKRTFERNKAESTESIEGKKAILTGFWRRKELYESLKVGDRIEAGVRNERTGTDVLSVIEGVRKVDQQTRKER